MQAEPEIVQFPLLFSSLLSSPPLLPPGQIALDLAMERLRAIVITYPKKANYCRAWVTFQETGWPCRGGVIPSQASANATRNIRPVGGSLVVSLRRAGG